MRKRLAAWLAPSYAYEQRWPLRRYAVGSGEHVCGLQHRRLRSACPACRAAL